MVRCETDPVRPGPGPCVTLVRGTANALIQTAQGKKLGGILTAQNDFLMVAVDLNSVSGLSLDEFTGDRVTFLGVVLEYTRAFI